MPDTGLIIPRQRAADAPSAAAPSRLRTLLRWLVLAVAITTLPCCRDTGHVTEVGFWFEGVTFELPKLHEDRLGGPIGEPERERIAAVARYELDIAFSSLRVRVTENRRAFFRVRVQQSLPGAAPAGESRVLVPLGGQGSVSFLTLAGHAVTYAPVTADRGAIIDGIGRGIGRAAVHEFAHQMLPGANLHTSRDDHSYEYANADRAAQYYGPMHWDLARPLLERRLGR